MGHFQLRDPGSPDLVNQLSKQGSGTFFVKPISKNEGVTPIQGRATVDILGRKVNIQLTHRVRDDVDPEPSVPKWSYIANLYSAFNPLTLIPDNDSKSFQSCYVFANAGNTTYGGSVNNIISNTNLGIGHSFTTYDLAKGSVESGSYDGSYDYESDDMLLCTFMMFYKRATVDPDTGDIIIPTDDSTSQESVRERLPCNAAISNVPSWMTNVHITYTISSKRIGQSNIDTNVYTSWNTFRSAWEVIRNNTTDYDYVYFSYNIRGKVATYSDHIRQRGMDPIAIQEIEGDEGKIWGAKSLYLYMGQLPGYKRIYLYYKKATTSEVTVPGSGGVYPVTAQSPGIAQVNKNNHKLWFQGEACDVITDEQSPSIIALNKITCKGVTDSTPQDFLNLDYSDDSKDREEYFYVGNPFFLGFVEETNLYKAEVSINLYDNSNALNFWHRNYFTVISNKCTYDPSWYNVGSQAHIYQGNSLNIKDLGYTILVPWAIRVGDTWNSPFEIPTAYSDDGLSTNSHRILAIDWIDKAENGSPALNKDTVKSTTDILYGGALSISRVMEKNQVNGSGWKFEPEATPDGVGAKRLRNYLEYLVQLWDNIPTAFGSPSDLRNVKEVLYIPIIVTGHKLCPSNPINQGIDSMCESNSLIPSSYSTHQGYATKIGIFPPTITEWYS